MSNDINNNRCNHDNCSKKLKLTDFSCKCEKTFCKLHRAPEDHECTYNYKCDISRKKKIEELKCVSTKIQKIE
mgnify:CR=1 FL=1